jgi:hypothetical protein
MNDETQVDKPKKSPLNTAVNIIILIFLLIIFSYPIFIAVFLEDTYSLVDLKENKDGVIAAILVLVILISYFIIKAKNRKKKNKISSANNLFLKRLLIAILVADLVIIILNIFYTLTHAASW